MGPVKIYNRSAWPAIMGIVHCCDGTRYTIKIDDDIVTVHLADNGLCNTTSAKRSRTTGFAASRMVRRYLQSMGGV
jgi:hypothetical protein